MIVVAPRCLSFVASVWEEARRRAATSYLYTCIHLSVIYTKIKLSGCKAVINVVKETAMRPSRSFYRHYRAERYSELSTFTYPNARHNRSHDYLFVAVISLYRPEDAGYY